MSDNADRKNDSDFSYFLRKNNRVLRTALRFYVYLGAVGSIVAAIYLAYSMLDPYLDDRQRGVFVIAAAFGGISLLSWAALRVMQAHAYSAERAKERWMASEFLEAWQEFEKSSKTYLQNTGEVYNARSLRSIIERLRRDAKIDSADVAILEEALLTRNEILHEGRTPSEPRLQSLTSKLGTLVGKLLGV